MAILVYQNIVRLDVSMDEITVIYILQSHNEFSSLESGHVFLENVEFDKKIHEVSSLHEIRDKLEMLGILECEEKFNDELRVALPQHIFFIADVNYLIFTADF